MPSLMPPLSLSVWAIFNPLPALPPNMKPPSTGLVTEGVVQLKVAPPTLLVRAIEVADPEQIVEFRILPGSWIHEPADIDGIRAKENGAGCGEAVGIDSVKG